MRSTRVLSVVAAGLFVWAWMAIVPVRASAQPVRAIGNGVVAGRVVDRGTHRPVPAATVEVAGADKATAVDELGEFTIPDVPPGSYTATAASEGYRPASIENVIVRDGDTSRIVFELEVDPLRLDEQVDVVGQLPRRSRSQPGNAFTLTGTELTTIAGTMGDFGRTLRSVPAAAGTSDERNTIVARGGNPVENVFFIDNIEIPNISHLPDWGSTGGLYSVIDPSAVGSFDFIVGGFPAKFGGALSSVTDIAYRDGARDRLHGQARFDIAMAAVAAEGPLPGDRGSWRASLRRADFTYLREIISMENANPRWTDAHVKATYEIAPRHSISFADVFNSDRAVDTGGSAHERTEIDQNTAGVNWRAAWSDRLRSETSVSQSSMTRIRGLEYPPPDDIHDWADSRKIEWVALRNENTFSVGTTLIQFGVQARRLKQTISYVVVPTAPGVILKSTGPWTYTTMETAAFGSLGMRPVRRLSAGVGARVEHSTASGRTHVSPRVSATFTVLDWLQVNGAAAIVHQPLPAEFLAIDPTFLALRDMRASQYSVGATLTRGPAWRATIEAYDKAYSALPIDPAAPHRLILDREPFRDYTFPLNLTDTGTGRSRGVEFMLERRAGRRFSALAAGRVSRNAYRDLSGVERNRLYDSRYGFTATGDYSPTPPWSISATLVVQDGTPYTPTNEEMSAAWGFWVRRGGLYNTLRYPTYVSLNARVERRFAVGKTTLAVYADCWNLLDRANVGWIKGWYLPVGPVYEYQMPRTPFVGMGIMF